MKDNLFAAVALALLVGFLGIIAWKVPQLPLIIVISVVLLMAVFDFWLELRRRRRKQGDGG